MTAVGAGAQLRERRERALLSTSELARALGVSQPLVSLWESGARPVRDDAQLAAVLARAGDPRTELARAVEAAGPDGLTEAQALAVSPRLRRRHLDELAEQQPHRVQWAPGSRLDARGRPYPTQVLVEPRHVTAQAVSEMGGAHVRGGRVLHGWSREQLARRLGVTAVAVSQWERGERPVPPARVGELRAALLSDVHGATLRAGRSRLGLGQAELARRVGVGAPTLHSWETGSRGRKPSEDQVLAVVAVLGEADAKPPGPSLVEQAWDTLRGVLELAGAEGLAAVELERRAQRSDVPAGQRGGRRVKGSGDARAQALRRAVRLGEVLEVDRFVATKGGGRRPVRHYVLRTLLDEPPVPAMTAAELLGRLRAAGWSQKRLAAALDVTPAAVTRWLAGSGLSGAWAVRVRELLPAAATGEDEVTIARRRLLAVIDERAGGRTEVYRAAGYGRDNRTAAAALEQLLAEQRVHWLELDNGSGHGGRARRVLRPGAGDTLTGAQARALRGQLKLSQVALGERLGVSGPMVSLWEGRGDRLIPGHRSRQLLALRRQLRTARAGADAP